MPNQKSDRSDAFGLVLGTLIGRGFAVYTPVGPAKLGIDFIAVSKIGAARTMAVRCGMVHSSGRVTCNRLPNDAVDGYAIVTPEGKIVFQKKHDEDIDLVF